MYASNLILTIGATYNLNTFSFGINSDALGFKACIPSIINISLSLNLIGDVIYSFFCNLREQFPYKNFLKINKTFFTKYQKTQKNKKKHSQPKSD